MEESPTPLLDKVNSPADIRGLSIAQLKALASEMRRELIETVSKTGGHLGAGLGVVELTLAMHYVFDTPQDKIIWDVGHQAYPHKMITGRRDRLSTLRQPDGLSGFCKRDESIYDVFGAGHSSTSISAGLGMAVARDFAGEKHEVIAVIGDGAMSAGMAYEALNNAGAMKKRLIVILNDNDMSISPAVGAMSNYLSRIVASHSYRTVRDLGKAVVKHLPDSMMRAAKRAEQYARGMVTGGGGLFEEMGFYYIGPVDGHNLDHLIPILKAVRDEDYGPVLIHARTQKGKGFAPAEAAHEKYHGVNQFDSATGVMHKKTAKAPAYTKVFADSLIEEARLDEKVVAITAAMPSGTGLDAFAAEFPERSFDVGIAEQHAVTFAAGLAAEGYKPFAAIYSTFLQRAYDQVVHDVAVQNLPVRFAIDRAGLVGADGPTHAGSFDVAYLSCLPNMVVMAAGDELELKHMVRTAAAYSEGPIAFRYPRGEGVGLALPARGEMLEIGKSRLLEEGSDAAILCFGARLQTCREAIAELKADNINVTLVDARFAKPLDEEMILHLMREHPLLLTVEEGSSGGFGAQVLKLVSDAGLLDAKPGVQRAAIRTLTLPDMFQEQGLPEAMYEEAGMGKNAIQRTIRELLGKESGNVLPLKSNTKK